jgi:hypothetical protein
MQQIDVLRCCLHIPRSLSVICPTEHPGSKLTRTKIGTLSVLKSGNSKKVELRSIILLGKVGGGGVEKSKIDLVH